MAAAECHGVEGIADFFPQRSLQLTGKGLKFWGRAGAALEFGIAPLINPCDITARQRNPSARPIGGHT